MTTTERRPVLHLVFPAVAWGASLALYTNSLFDLLGTAPIPPSASPRAAILSGITTPLSQFTLPVSWLLTFAGSLTLSSLFLPPNDRGTLRWLRQGWLGAVIGFVGGLSALPRGLLIIDVVLLGLSLEGLRSAATALVHRLAAPDAEASGALVRNVRDRDPAT